MSENTSTTTQPPLSAEEYANLMLVTTLLSANLYEPLCDHTPEDQDYRVTAGVIMTWAIEFCEVHRHIPLAEWDKTPLPLQNAKSLGGDQHIIRDLYDAAIDWAACELERDYILPARAKTALSFDIKVTVDSKYSMSDLVEIMETIIEVAADPICDDLGQNTTQVGKLAAEWAKEFFDNYKEVIPEIKASVTTEGTKATSKMLWGQTLLSWEALIHDYTYLRLEALGWKG